MERLARPLERTSTGVSLPTLVSGRRGTLATTSLSSSSFPLSQTSMSNPASSAPFQVGSPSPPSPTPAAGSQKEQHPPFISSDQIPQTPASPLMSVSTQNYATNFASSQASPQATSQPANLSSPPSSVPMSTQVSQQPTVSTANSFPTPASSISGHFINSTFTDDTEHVDKHGAGNQGLGATSAPDEKMESIHQTEQAHRRTDHDRDAGPGTESGSTDYGIQGTTKDGDAMDIDQGAPAPSSAESSLDSLRKDFTSAFHLCKSCKNSPISIPCAPVEISHPRSVSLPLGLSLLTLVYPLQPTLRLVQTYR